VIEARRLVFYSIGCLFMVGGWWVAGLDCSISLGLAEYPVVYHQRKGGCLHANFILVGDGDHGIKQIFVLKERGKLQSTH